MRENPPSSQREGTKPVTPPASRAWPAFGVLFLLVAAAIIEAGVFYYRTYQRHFRADAERQLSTIADLKVAQIADWRRERLADANYVQRTPYTARRALDALAQPDSGTTRRMFTSWLNVLMAGGQFDQALLLDEGLNIRLIHPPRVSNALSQVEHRAAEQALRSRQVTVADLHRVSNGPVYLSLMVPLLVRREGARDNVPPAGTDPSPADRSAALLVLRINADKTLYPLIKRWPTPSRTAETLLIRRDDNDALFLNELRFRTNTALTLRSSLLDSNLPAVKAVLGQKGVVEGRDYRGVPVIADLRPVPDSPWFMVARMDAAEVDAPLRERLWQMMVTIGALLFGTGAGVGLVWRQQHLRFYQERAAAAEMIRQNEARFRTLVENIPQKIFIKDLDLRWVSVNNNFALDLGHRPEEVVGKNDYDFFPKGLADKYRADDERIIQTGQTEELEEKHLQDGRETWVHVVKTPVRDEQGRITGVFGIFWDITERKRAQEALEESEASLREAQRIASLGSYVLDIPSGLWRSSDVLDDLFGIDQTYPRSVEGWMALVYPADRAMMADYFKNEVLGQGRTFDKEYRIVSHKAQAERWVHGLGKLEFDAQGHPVKMHGTIQDITERQKAQEALRQSELKLRAVLDATPFPIALVDIEDKRIAFWSRSALALFGHTAPTAKEWYQLAYPDPAYQREVVSRWKPALEKALLSGQAVNAGEYQVTCHDGSVRICELYATFLADNLIVTFHDITQRKQAEDETHKLNTELEERVRHRTADLEAANKDLEAFSYSVSHDLRAPLRAIAGFARILVEEHGPQLPAAAQRYLDIVQSNTLHMGHLVDDLLALSRLGRQEMATETLEPAQLVRQALELLRGEQEGRNVKITVGDLPPCRGDAALLRQVFVNLLSNALKFTVKRDPAVIEVGFMESCGDGVAASPQDSVPPLPQQASGPVFFVRDNGVGFDMRYVHKLFGVFQRLHRMEDYAGTGIGLAIVQRIIQRHGGRVWAESELDKGATFYFTLEES